MKIRLCHKIKLITAIKTFTKYNERSRVASKQTNKQTNTTESETQKTGKFRQKSKKTYLQIDTQADLQSTYAHRE